MPNEVLGLELVGEMPDLMSALGAIVIVKALDHDGDVCYYVRGTEGLTSVEAMGMVHFALLQLSEGMTTSE